MLAVGVPRIRETLPGAALRAFAGIFRSDHHRLHHGYIAALAKLAKYPGELDGSFLGLVYAICRSDFDADMSAAAGHADPDPVRVPQEEDGLVDSLRLVLAGNCQASRRLFRLLTC